MVNLTPQQLSEIFMPYHAERASFVKSNNIRFVHYTRAETAMSILQNREMWLRKSSCMNDYMEIEHGLACLYRTFKDSHFRSAIDGLFPEMSNAIAEHFDAISGHFRAETYLSCFSEHDNRENLTGRLSMWRAYGHGTGVALVMNNAPFFSESNALRAFSSPVAYWTDQQVKSNLDRIGANLDRNAALLQEVGRDLVKHFVVHLVLKLCALCTKHPGFEEEREWRVVYSPSIEQSPYITRAVENIGGVPQPVHKVEMKNIPEEGFTGAEIPELIDRIIIGPTDYPAVIWDAFVQILFEAGVQDAASRVVISNIPLRRS